MGWLLVTAALIVVVATAQQPRLRTQSLPSLPPGSLDKLFASRTAEYGTLSPQWISAGFTLSARRGVSVFPLISVSLVFFFLFSNTFCPVGLLLQTRFD